MKVKIGPYKNWIGPYQLAEALCFWAKDVDDEHGFPEKPEYVHNFGRWLAKSDWLSNLCVWIERKRQRKIKIKIDKWDTWNADHTLALIILPTLKQLKETTHSCGNVEDKDVPEELRNSEVDEDSLWPDNVEERWNWALDEMIFAFEHMVDDDWEEEFRSGEIDLKWIPLDENHNETTKENAKMYEMTKGPNDTYECDHEGMKKVQDRIQNGLRLFGKHFQSLWD